MKLTKSQSGIAHVLLVVLVAVVLGAIGFAGWRVYDSSKTKPAANTQTNQTAQTEEKKEEQNYLTVKEWAVKIPIEQNKEIKYELKDDGKSAIFYTNTSKSLCSDTQGFINHFGITVLRGKADDKLPAHTDEGTGSFKQEFDSLENPQSYGYYIKPFLLGSYYYFHSQSSYLDCIEASHANSSQAEKDAKQSELEEELKYIRTSVEQMKAE